MYVCECACMCVHARACVNVRAPDGVGVSVQVGVSMYVYGSVCADVMTCVNIGFDALVVVILVPSCCSFISSGSLRYWSGSNALLMEGIPKMVRDNPTLCY
jgi:hypothetical protein